MAEVFLAKAAGPMGFEKTLVVKRILPHLAEDPAFVEMFLGEATLAAQLNHPNVVQIFDFGEAEAGSYFIAMEYIDGPNLRALGKRAAELGVRLPFNVVAKIISFACEGLAYAHDFANPETGEPLELIHRDISPDNILVSRQGAVKVVDFGIAKAAGRGSHTKTGSVKGKLAYMPPEQLNSLALDRRADVFSLSMVLYELLTGMRPFDATSEVSIMQAILFQPLLPARARRADVPESLQAILDRGLAKDREQRYVSCRELQADLERFILVAGEAVGPFHLAKLVAQLAAPSAAGVSTPSKPGRSPGGSLRGPEPSPVAPTQMNGPVSVRTASPPRASRPRWPKVALGSSGVLLLSAVLFFALRGTGGGEVPAPPSEPIASNAPTPPAPAPPKADPPPAPVKVDEGVHPEPAKAELPRDPAPRRADKKPTGKSSRATRPVVVARTEPEAAPDSASFEVEASPSSQVLVNGKVVCGATTRCKVKNQPAGSVKVELADPQGAFAKTFTLEVHSGDNGLKQLAVAQGTLEFRIRPYATVSLDGRSLGQTPFPAVQAFEGAHKVTLVNKDLNKELTVPFTVKPGQTNIFKYNLEE